MDCIFCKIIAGRIPCYKLYEDDETLVFLDISKDVDGHCLVIPKSHVSDMETCDEKLYLKVMAVAKKMTNHFISLGYDGANLVTNCKAAAGQEVGHFHVHVYPRKEGDGARLVMNKALEVTELEKIAEKLRLN